LYRPILERMVASSRVDVKVLVGGAHFDKGSGRTIDEIKACGFTPACRVECHPRQDTARGMADAMAGALAGFARAYSTLKPDCLLVLGDRFEMFSAVSAAVPFRIPVAHLHGGELTEGAIDNQFRHAISKLSHLHFVATPACRQRLVQMGEEPWRIHVTGAPGLDNVKQVGRVSRRQLMDRLGFPASTPFLLVTFHPETLGTRPAAQDLQEVLSALEATGMAVVMTYPNVDTGRGKIISLLQAAARRNLNFRLVDNLGTSLYFSAMEHASAMVGNSSSGIIEAASFKLPVVNVGNRQAGRERSLNVVDVPCERKAVGVAIARVLSPGFSVKMKACRNIYGDGKAAPRIARVLETIPLGPEFLCKRFGDLPAGEASPCVE
jgi:UDP-hydrolysing UDP-N-acetyl-D-glucosamine 2-epimerase